LSDAGNPRKRGGCDCSRIVSYRRMIRQGVRIAPLISPRLAVPLLSAELGVGQSGSAPLQFSGNPAPQGPSGPGFEALVAFMVGCADRDRRMAPNPWEDDIMAEYTLPPLPYDYGALEPNIDAKTMEIHHTKHHQAYVTNLNNALKDHPDQQ